ncbi:MAG: T9SS type A sorting domain-containing protein [Candidatus Stahlbacteria bacterium]|nr:T9SS type A sorting domain-containing protein [Candidatus Stahlbacteria bacterium]
MKGRIFMVLWGGVLLVGFLGAGNSWGGPLIIDHTCTDLSIIPNDWIDSVKAKCKLHYAHTSHGSQLTTGMARIETNNSFYAVAINYSSLPTEANVFCIFDGQESVTYITPDLYWRTQDGMNRTRNVLNHNPSIKYSMWSWCCQLTSYSVAQVQAYLDSITKLETEYPNVTFIYMTCNAQETGGGGYNRHLRNQQIRQYCNTNNKVLFDFADLDAWWYNPGTSNWEFASYSYNDSTIPVEHSHFNGNEAGHTTYESCEQKGKAVWWMFAVLAGWKDSVGIEENANREIQNAELQANPNPFVQTTFIGYQLSANSQPLSAPKIQIYDMGGRLVEVAKDNIIGKDLEAGIYFVKVDGKALKKIVKLSKLTFTQ